METLFNDLKRIDEILEQISTITANQTTVLLQAQGDEAEEDLKMIEDMVAYKEQLICELEAVEDEFNKRYNEKKGELKDRDCILKFKACVAKILDKKQQIQEMEQNNVRILQARAAKSREKVVIAKPASEVAAAYSKHAKS